MSTTITAQDGTDDATSPAVVEGFESDSDSGNIVTRMIAPGVIAVTLVGDLPRTGTLRLRYRSDTAAETARALLGRRTSFVMSTTERHALDFEFVRDGRLGAVTRSGSDWTLDVGYQEVLP